MGTWIFTETRRSWTDSTAPLPSTCLDASMLSKCHFPRAKELVNGSFGFPLRPLICSEWWGYRGWLARSLLKRFKKRPFIPSLRLPSTDPLNCAKNGSPQRWLCTISTNSASLKAEGKEPDRSDLVLESESQRKKTLPNPMKWSCIICMMGPSVALFAKNFVVPADTKLPPVS